MIEMNMSGINFITSRWPLDTGRQTIVFIHGSGSSCMFWKAQVDGLAGRVNTIALDLPGHGKSGGSSMESIEAFSLAVGRLIESINAPSPIPCGLSMGGAITLQMLLDKRDCCAGIVINSGARLKVMPAIFDLIKKDYMSYVRSLPAMGFSGKTDSSIMQDVVAIAGDCNPDVVYNDFSACNSFDVMERLHEIKVPVLVLTAEEDKLSPAKYGRYLAENIAASHIENIMDAGHMSPVEKPDQVNQAILGFLDKLS